MAVRGPEGSEGTADTLKALHVVSKSSVCIIDTLGTEYITLL